MATLIDIATDPSPRLWTVDEYHRMADVGIFDGKSVELIDGVVIDKTTGESHAWTVTDYYRLGDAGFFLEERVQLIDGEVLRMSPQGARHAYQIHQVADLVRPRLTKGSRLLIQSPLDVDKKNEPEPDLAVVATDDFHGKAHPKKALLVIEVSDSTLAFDRGRKARRYASTGVQDYWIVNLKDNQVEVFRNPIPDAANPHVFRYADVQTYRGSDKITSPALHESVTAVELLN